MAREVEYKFVVTRLPESAETDYDFVPIRQGYIAQGPPVVRVRRYGERGFLTLKGRPEAVRKGEPLSRLEFEYEIPAEDADALLAQCAAKLEKRRARLASGIELDIFEGALAGLVFAEFECSEGCPPPDPPDGWEWRDVTTEQGYSNNALANVGLPPGAPLVERFKRYTLEH